MSSRNVPAALITGASRGLGLALAQALAARGWKLIVDGRGADALHDMARTLRNRTEIVAIPGDVADDAHQAALGQAARSIGGLDAVINNASILGPSPQPALLDYPPDMLLRVFQTNVVAPLAVIQAVKDHLRPNARIINVTSDAGIEAYPGWGGYGASKAALEHLSAVLAAENPHWRVYWVDPGDMRTQMHQEAFPGEDISDRPLPETSVPGFIQLLEGDLPGGRYRAQRILDEMPHGRQGPQQLRVVLTAADFDHTASFYRDGLGLQVLQTWNNPDGRGMILDAGRATLEVHDQEQTDTLNSIEAGASVSGQFRLAFQVADIWDSSVSLLKTGAISLGGVVNTPWGHLNRRFSGPDAVQLTLFQNHSEQAESINP